MCGCFRQLLVSQCCEYNYFPWKPSSPILNLIWIPLSPPLKSAWARACIPVCWRVCVLPVAVAVCWCRWGPGRTTPPARRRTEPSRGRTESACCSWRPPGRWTSPCCPAHLEKKKTHADAPLHHWWYKAARTVCLSFQLICWQMTE